MINAKAYYSDPEHNRSFVGRWLYIYRGTGGVTITDEFFEFKSESRHYKLTRDQIIDLKLGEFPRTAKPIKLNFIHMELRNGQNESEAIYLVPQYEARIPALVPVWKTNRLVSSWLQMLQDWISCGKLNSHNLPT